MDSADTAPPVEATPEFLPNIKNIVVVMFENRSFDNLLGYLYSDGSAQAGWPAGLTPPPVVPAPQSFDGLWKFLDHPLPCSGLKGCNLDSAGNPVWTYPYPTPAAELDWRHPYPNAEEGYANYERHQFEHDMGGFATDYEKRFPLPAPAPSPPLVPAQSVPSPTMIMGSYPPSQLPVLSTLARNFAVFDHWFCAVPSETYCNRSFFHAATSSGYLYNAPQEVDKANGIATQTAKWKNNSSLTILERLSEASTPVSWKVYYEPAQDNELKRGLTALIHPQAFSKYPDRFVGVDFAKPSANAFFTDVATGALPQYTFIEPLYASGNDCAPQSPADNPGHDFHADQDVRYGEEVLRQVYEAIRATSGSATHDYTQDTLLLVVFDEHGGTYDHVQPPKGVPAPPAVPSPYHAGMANFDVADPGNASLPIFDFTNLGARVPAIAISAYTTAGTVISNPVHHSAVIRTLVKKFALAALPNPREADPNGGDLGIAVNNATPRPGSTWPALTTSALPPSATLCTPVTVIKPGAV